MIPDFDKLDFEDKEPEEDVKEKEKEKEDEEEESIEEEDESSDDEVPENKSAKNSALAVGWEFAILLGLYLLTTFFFVTRYKYDRSFVVRGSQIGVFSHTPNKKMKYNTTIKNVKTPSGQFFSPKKVRKFG